MVKSATETVYHLDRILETTLLDVGLSDEGDFGHGAGLETPFHRRQGRLLIAGNQLGLRITGWKRNQNCGNETDQRPVSQVESGLFVVRSSQRVERTDGGNHERPVTSAAT